MEMEGDNEPEAPRPHPAGVLVPGGVAACPGSLVGGAGPFPPALVPRAAGHCWRSNLLMSVICTLNVEYLPHYSSYHTRNSWSSREIT